MTAWSGAKVKKLIMLFSDNKEKFGNHLLKKKDVWKDITNQLNSDGGVQYTCEEVAKKWRNLKDRLDLVQNVCIANSRNILVTFMSQKRTATKKLLLNRYSVKAMFSIFYFHK
jgi:Myb/SANT-like DNA-binding domain